MVRSLLSLLAACLLLGTAAHATDDGGLQARISQLQRQWAIINYQKPKSERKREFARLAEEAHAVVAAYPNRAEPLIWEGIIRASLAGATGGLSALGIMKDAKALLERAIAIDGTALHGAAYTSLGSFYYMVPGWPLGYGDDDKALEYLKKGLEIAPDDMDANYFMGDYWLDQGDKRKAERYFRKVLSLPDVKDRPVYSKGRKQEAATKLAGMR
ncbi:MAG: hypothetical protein D6682_00650 [Zetaproteobacteria bacterium]|nr:MAG: hypothetical protein D6682_00650 [Zetaproteobacteria bacterium]